MTPSRTHWATAAVLICLGGWAAPGCNLSDPIAGEDGAADQPETDTTPPRDALDTGDTSDDVSPPPDTAPGDTCSALDGGCQRDLLDCDTTADGVCLCNFRGNSSGVCGGQPPAPDGGCSRPANYEPTETSCDDGLDNDCDGSTDRDDANCGRLPAGSSCSEDDECRSRCISGTCAHRIFATSDKRDGKIGGLSGADQECNQLASRAGLQGNWKALLSTPSTSAASRLTIDAAVVRVDGTKVADGASTFWQEDHQAPIEIDEEGNAVTGRVWTGTNPDGTSDGTNDADSGQFCRSWTNAAPVRLGESGDSTADSGGRWVLEPGSSGSQCSEMHRLYCLDGQ